MYVKLTFTPLAIRMQLITYVTFTPKVAQGVDTYVVTSVVISYTLIIL